MCGPLAAAVGPNPREQIPYHAGRVTTYAALGALTGAFGHALAGPPWLGTAITTVLLVLLAASIAGWVPEPRAHLPGVARVAGALLRRRDPLFRYGFGVAHGLLPCGLLYAALAVPVGLASAPLGALAMALFALLTAPALIFATLGVRKVLSRFPGGRYALALVVLLSGLLSLGVRERLLPVSAAPDAATESSLSE